MVKSEQKIQSKAMSPSCSLSPSSPPSPNSYKKKFKGVRMRSWGSWVSEIRAPNQKTRIWLGSYSTPEAAARAYDAALLCLKGSSANLNFPNNSIHLPPDTILSPKSIQRVAAAAAANLDPPPQHSAPPPSPLSPPLTSSSFSNQIDDTIQIHPESHYYSSAPYDDEHWYEFDAFQSPKYVDPMITSMFYNPPSMIIDDQLYEDGDIRLWSFC